MSAKTLFLVPYYNHPATIKPLSAHLKGFGLDILIIDDGSDEISKQALRELEAEFQNEAQNAAPNSQDSGSKLFIYTRANNGGKGAAVKDGLKYANELGYTHALQIDADMQHDIASIETLLSLSAQHPTALIAAAPKFDKSAPKSRLYARKITNFWVHLNTLSFNIKDSMCGFRVYALKPILPLLERLSANRMDFDIEILLRAFKNGVSIIWCETPVKYDEKGVSHFKAFKDNLLISKTHAKHFFLLPFYAPKRLKNVLFKSKFKKAQNSGAHKNLSSNLNKNSSSRQGFESSNLNLDENSNQSLKKAWFERKEKGNSFWLKLTLFLVQVLPKPILSLCVGVVSFIYYLFSKEERANLRAFYENLHAFSGQKRLWVYRNFYAFAYSICDKIAVWKKQIRLKDLRFSDKSLLYNELVGAKKGHIIIGAHFGNIEITRAISNEEKVLKMTILMHRKNAEKFLNFLGALSNKELEIIFVDDFDISTMLRLKQIIEDGGHIGIMGDRVSVSGSKNARASFLNKPCLLPQGAFLLAHLLKTKLSFLSCDKEKSHFNVNFMPINYDETGLLSFENRSSELEFCMRKYIANLEKLVMKNPTQWFNFYDFWGQHAKNEL